MNIFTVAAVQEPAKGLMQVLSDDHPLVKYGSWDKVPADEQYQSPTPGPLARLQELAQDLRREQAVIDAVNSRYENGFFDGYRYCIKAVDELIRKEQRIIVARNEFHARSAVRP